MTAYRLSQTVFTYA